MATEKRLRASRLNPWDFLVLLSSNVPTSRAAPSVPACRACFCRAVQSVPLVVPSVLVVLVELPHGEAISVPATFLPTSNSNLQFLHVLHVESSSAHRGSESASQTPLTPAGQLASLTFSFPLPLTLPAFASPDEHRGVPEAGRGSLVGATIRRRLFAMFLPPHAPIHTWSLVFNIKKHCQHIIA
jgi:hypothetical protein